MSYNEFAESFARSRKKAWPDLEELMNIGQGVFGNNLGSVLDVGCGSGRLFPLLKEHFKLEKYTGIDIAGELLRIAQEESPDGKFVELDMQNLGQIGQTYDTIFCIASFHHLLDQKSQKTVLQGIFDRCRQGGHVAMLNWNLLAPELSKKYAPTEVNGNIFAIPFTGIERLYYGFHSQELEELFTSSGYQVEYNDISATGRNSITIATKARGL